MSESSDRREVFKNIHGEGDSGLVVLNRSEGPGLGGGDRCVTGNNDTEDITLHGDTEGQGSNVQKDKVLSLI